MHPPSPVLKARPIKSVTNVDDWTQTSLGARYAELLRLRQSILKMDYERNRLPYEPSQIQRPRLTQRRGSRIRHRRGQVRIRLGERWAGRSGVDRCSGYWTAQRF